MIKRCDLAILDCYDQEDRLPGYIDSVDRRGNREQFPIMSLSIAVVTNEHQAIIIHPGDVSTFASELKKAAKAMRGSVYVKDRAALTVARALTSSLTWRDPRLARRKL